MNVILAKAGIQGVITKFVWVVNFCRSYEPVPMNVIPAKAGIHGFSISFGLVPQN
jgi:hypothetical protein